MAARPSRFTRGPLLRPPYGRSVPVRPALPNLTFRTIGDSVLKTLPLSEVTEESDCHQASELVM